jgi:hypothetical protein
VVLGSLSVIARHHLCIAVRLATPTEALPPSGLPSALGTVHFRACPTALFPWLNIPCRSCGSPAAGATAAANIARPGSRVEERPAGKRDGFLRAQRWTSPPCIERLSLRRHCNARNDRGSRAGCRAKTDHRRDLGQASSRYYARAMTFSADRRRCPRGERRLDGTSATCEVAPGLPPLSAEEQTCGRRASEDRI